MIYLKRFNESSETLEELCKIYIDGNKSNKVGPGGLTYSIDNGYVNVDCGNGNMSLDIKEDKIPIKFGTVKGSVFLRGNIVSLENSPREITFAFNIMSCHNLTSLKGGPDRIGHFYHCGSIPLDSISGLARPIGDNYTLTISETFGTIHEILGLFLTPKIEYSGRKKHGEFIIDDTTDDLIDLFNSYDPLRGETVYLNRLNGFLEEVGKETVTSVEGYNCI
jgi:hypothetical protein